MKNNYKEDKEISPDKSDLIQQMIKHSNLF